MEQQPKQTAQAKLYITRTYVKKDGTVSQYLGKSYYQKKLVKCKTGPKHLKHQAAITATSTAAITDSVSTSGQGVPTKVFKPFRNHSRISKRFVELSN